MKALLLWNNLHKQMQSFVNITSLLSILVLVQCTLYIIKLYIHYTTVYISHVYTLYNCIHFTRIYIIQLYTFHTYIHYTIVYISHVYTLYNCANSTFMLKHIYNLLRYDIWYLPSYTMAHVYSIIWHIYNI